ncbi:hypothetical protein [Pseudooceanicola sp.]|uniref:hypothetical protein n=1 Tax=Pseudooceanicola sp. TaxID=1914328 RepID=UPI004059342C
MAKTDTTGPLGDAALDALLAEARDTPDHLPDALMARMLADAEAAQDARAQAVAPAPQRRGRLARAFAGIGGWPALAGFATATVAGIWIGISPPAVVSDGAAYYVSGGGAAEDLYLVDTMPAYDRIAAEVQEDA